MTPMMIFRVLPLTLALAACGGSDDTDDAGGSQPPASVANAVSRLDAMAADLMARSKVPGMSVAVVYEGRPIYLRGFGVRRNDAAGAVDADTVFPLASLSKSLGATVVAHQVGQGKITWDSPVAPYLPWFKLGDYAHTQALTVADLYSHRSGLGDHVGDHLEDIGYDRRGVLERLAYVPVKPLRSSYAYSNFGITAGAEAVAAAAGTSWEDLSDSVLYGPLRMTRTSSRYADFVARDNRVAGHMLHDGRFEVLAQRQPDAQSPAGGVSSSARDMARWMALVLGEGTLDGRSFVNRDALLAATKLQMTREDGSQYGYGFGVGTDHAGNTVLSHSGAFQMGAGTYYRMVPSLNLGIAVLTNGSPTGAAEALGTLFFEHAQNAVSGNDWYALYNQYMVTELYPPFGKLAGQEPPLSPAPPLALENYVGRYTNDYAGDARVSLAADGTLALHMGPDGKTTYALRHWDGNRYVFDLVNENANFGSVSSAWFETDAQGRMVRLRIEYFAEGQDGVFNRVTQ